MAVNARLRLLLLSACLRAGRLETAALKSSTLEAHDLLDLGASKNAHSATFLKGLQAQLPKGGRALRMATLDSNPAKVATCNAAVNAAVRTCVTADVTSLARSSPPLVTGAVLFHVLEHITSSKRRNLMVLAQKQNATLATVVLSSAASLAKLFVYVRGPSFDDATDLRKLGFTRYYETWAANTCHFNSTHLIRAFRDIASRRRDAKWVVVLGQPLATSQHDAMLPLGMPVDSFPYSHDHNRDSRLPKTKGFNLAKIPFYGAMLGLLVFDDAPAKVDGIGPSGAIVDAVVHDLLTKTKDGRRVLHCSHGWNKCLKIRNVKERRRPISAAEIAQL